MHEGGRYTRAVNNEIFNPYIGVKRFLAVGKRFGFNNEPFIQWQLDSLLHCIDNNFVDHQRTVAKVHIGDLSGNFIGVGSTGASFSLPAR